MTAADTKLIVEKSASHKSIVFDISQADEVLKLRQKVDQIKLASIISELE